MILIFCLKLNLIQNRDTFFSNNFSVKKEEAEEIKKKLEGAGAKVELK